MKIIMLIPVSLCIIAFLSSFGPWSAFNISKYSQISRFKEVLIKNDMLVAGIIKRKSKEISFKHEKQISSIVDYFEERGRINDLQPFFSQNFDSLFVSDTLYRYREDKSRKLLDIMGLQYISSWQTGEQVQDQKYFYFNTKDVNPLNIEGYDYLLEYYRYFYDDDDIFMEYYEAGDEKLLISVDRDTLELKIFLNDELISTVKLNPLINKLKNNYSYNQYNIPADVMTLQTENDKYKVKILFTTVNLEKIKDDLKLSQLQADILIGRKE